MAPAAVGIHSLPEVAGTRSLVEEADNRPPAAEEQDMARGHSKFQSEAVSERNSKTSSITDIRLNHHE